MFVICSGSGWVSCRCYRSFVSRRRCISICVDFMCSSVVVGGWLMSVV